MAAHNSGNKVEVIAEEAEEPEVPTEQSARIQDVVVKAPE
jgi:hypothetical protein